MTFGEQPPVYSVFSSPSPPMPQPNVPYPTQPYSTPYPPMPTMPMPGIPGLPTNPQNQMPDFSLRPSLITAAEEKLRRKLEDTYLSSEIIKKTGDQLAGGKARLDCLVQQIENEKDTLNQHIGTLQNEISQLETKISKQKTEEDGAMIDDAINAPTPLFRQIVNTFAEESAVEDTIYYLGEALRSEKLDLEQYLKHVRVLSRKQFMLRALVQKCRVRAGLAG